MNFTPNQVKNCLVTNLVEEYRNGVRVGSTMREMTFVILDNCANDAPVSPVSGIQNSNVLVDSSDNLMLSVCEGQTSNISFDIHVTDPNGDNTNVTFSNLQDGASITVDNNGTDSPVVHFVWNVNEAAPGNYIFYITYTDDGCPLVVTKTVAYTIRIDPHPYVLVGGNQNACIGKNDGKAWVIPGPGVNFDYSYVWVNMNGDTLRQTNSTTGDTLNNVAEGTYKVYIRNAEGCGKKYSGRSEGNTTAGSISTTGHYRMCSLPIDISTTTQPDVSYRWNTGDTICCITAKEGGVYILTATNLCGDVADSTIIEHVKCNYLFVCTECIQPQRRWPQRQVQYTGDMPD